MNLWRCFRIRRKPLRACATRRNDGLRDHQMPIRNRCETLGTLHKGLHGAAQTTSRFTRPKPDHSRSTKPDLSGNLDVSIRNSEALFCTGIPEGCAAEVGGGGNCSYEYTIGTRAGNSMVPTLIPYGDEPQHHEVLLLSVATLPLAMSHMWIAVDICFHRLSVNLQSASYVVFALLARSALRWTRMHKPFCTILQCSRVQFRIV